MRQAAQDGTLLYLALLPAELRAEVDRLSREWWHQVRASTVRPVDAPAYAGADRVHYALPNGASVVIISRQAETFVLHFERGLTTPPRVLKIADTFLRVISAALTMLWLCMCVHVYVYVDVRGCAECGLLIEHTCTLLHS